MKHAIFFLSIFLLSNYAHAQALTVNVTSFKANGADTIDDTKAIQDCIDYVANKGGGVVFFPKGNYIISNRKIPGKAICLSAKSNVSFEGENQKQTILKLADNQPAFSSVLTINNASNISIEKLTIDGNYKNQHVVNNEHSHGILIDRCDSIKVFNCTLVNTCGDGLGIRGVQTSSTNIRIKNCSFNGNQRDGIVLGSGFNGVKIENCFFGKDIVHDAIHTEPERGSFFGNVLIENNNIETSNNITIAGSSSDTMATNYLIQNNTLKSCSIYMVYASGVTIQNNVIENSAQRSAVTIFKNCDNIVIRNNQFTVNHNAAFTITYSGNRFSKNIIIDSNTINFNVADVPCFQIKGCDDIQISNNKIITQGNPKTLLDISATRTMSKLDFSNNDVGYFKNNFSFKSVNNNIIYNFSARNNRLANKSVSLDAQMNSKMKNTLLQNNH